MKPCHVPSARKLILGALVTATPKVYWSIFSERAATTRAPWRPPEFCHPTSLQHQQFFSPQNINGETLQQASPFSSCHTSAHLGTNEQGNLTKTDLGVSRPSDLRTWLVSASTFFLFPTSFLRRVCTSLLRVYSSL